MKLNKFTVILAILLISILAIGAVSAESVDDSDALAIDEDVGVVQESVEPADVAEDLSTAEPEVISASDTVDDIVNEESNAVLAEEAVSYDIDDDSYSTYFYENGTAKETLSGDYSLNIGTLNNKDIKIISGSHINIIAKEGAGFINNGTITIGDKTDYPGSIVISGLTFTNTDKNGIVLEEGTSIVEINNNKFDLTYSNINNAMPIASYGYVYGVKIANNIINVDSAATNNYGIDIMLYNHDESGGWGDRGISNPDNFEIIGNNITITCSDSSSMAEGIYLDTITNSVVKDNNINVKTVGTTVNYGMQIADSYPWTDMSDPLNSAYNISIEGNTFELNSNDMVYGLTVISLSNMDMIEYEDLIRNFIITGNTINIKSGTGAIGVGLKTSDVELAGNTIIIDADSTKPVQASVDNEFGSESSAIDVVNYQEYIGIYYNITVVENIISANVESIKVLQDESGNQPLVIEDNIIADFIIDDDNYATYFNEDGTIKEDSGIKENSTIIIGELTNKKLVIDVPVKIGGMPGNNALVNTTLALVDGADGTIVSSMNFIYEDDGSATFAIISVNDGVSDLKIVNNNITTVSAPGWNYNMAISIYGSEEGSKNITIAGNYITMTGESSGLYGIDAQDYDASWKKGKATDGLNIYANYISLSGPGMVEPIYVAGCSNVKIEGNHIDSISTGTFKGNDAYGIGASGNTNFTASGNIINVTAQMMAFGISSAKATNALMEYNTITAVGTGAIGIGFVDNKGVTVSDNTINITGGDCYSIESWDALKTGNGAILNKTGNENVNIGTNTITENLPLTIDDDNYATYFNDDGTIKEGAGISNDDVIFLDKLTNKKIVIDIPLTVRGASGNELINTTIDIVTGADGTVVSNLNIDFEDATGDSIGVIGLFDASDITIKDNTISVKSIEGPSGDYGPSNSAMAIAVYAAPEVAAKNIVIDGNTITMTGAAPYTYGIDVYNYYNGWTKGQAANNVKITNNALTLSGSGVQEAIYVTMSENVTIEKNTATVTSEKEAYGIGTATVSNAEFKENTLSAYAGTVAYGITSTNGGKNLNIFNNTIYAEGTGAVGLGLVGDENINIESNGIEINGGDYTKAASSDYRVGAANAGILEKDNSGVTISNNDVTETSAVRLDTTIEASDITVTAAPSGNGNLEITLKTVSGMVLANQNIKVVFDNQVLELTTDAKGVAVLPFALNKAGTYNVDIFYLGDDNYRGADATAKVTINKIKTALTASGKTFLATATTKKLTATLKDANGNALAKKTVTFTVNGKTYKATTNAKGVATVKLALKAAKTYTVSIKFAGDSVYAASTKSVKVKLNKEKTKITAPKKTFKRTAKTKKVVITLKNSKGKAIAKKKVTLIVNKKKYTVKTNKKGKATFKVKLTKKGTFKYTAKFAGDTQYKAVTKKTGKIRIK
ncbi:Ig-like domain repeat protein [uncultured Methanobrevibacter sp.]|uniref:Ig-like domain repeat protein n=1 Tax=uncultured Methanobrevibacter sp. TaxID=253161 RepID=UPI00260995A9|nr:Ig-like domain repeat protein [uncultured Methanobrevibacter sp.]